MHCRMRRGVASIARRRVCRNISSDVYTHGHHVSVVGQHSARTAEHSAKFLLPHLAEGDKLLDVGCGPGSITVGLAQCVGPKGHVTAVDVDAGIVQRAAAAMQAAGLDNTTCRACSAYDLPFAENSFDVAYAHQTLQHLSDPVAALVEMRRVVRPGGYIAVRDADYSSMLGHPTTPAIDEWRSLYRQVATRNGAQPDAGRHLVSWILAAGLPLSSITFTASAVVYAPGNEPWRSDWGGAWAERTRHSAFGQQALAYGLAKPEQLERLANAWEAWAADPSALFYYLNGEALVRVPYHGDHFNQTLPDARVYTVAGGAGGAGGGASAAAAAAAAMASGGGGGGPAAGAPLDGGKGAVASGVTEDSTASGADAVREEAMSAAPAASIQPSGIETGSVETRCAHCFITFATPHELQQHAAHHCFPHDPTEVLRRFPIGSEALDTVNGQTVIVLGEAGNQRRAHAAVAAREVRRGLVADVAISRLELVRRGHKRGRATWQSHGQQQSMQGGQQQLVIGQRHFGATRPVCSKAGRPSPTSYRTEPLLEIPQAPVSDVSRAITLGSARYIDCRSEAEMSGGVVAGAVNLPFPHNGAEVVTAADFVADVEAEGFARDTPLVIGCRSGARSALAVEALINAGYTDVRNVEGGIRAWVTAGLPIEPFSG